MKLGYAQVDMSPKAVTKTVDGDQVTFQITPNTPAMKDRAGSRASVRISRDAQMVELDGLRRGIAYQLVEILKGWEGVTDPDGKPVGCNNDTKMQMGMQYPETAQELVEDADDLYQERLKEREQQQGN